MTLRSLTRWRLTCSRCRLPYFRKNEVDPDALIAHAKIDGWSVSPSRDGVDIHTCPRCLNRPPSRRWSDGDAW